MRTINTKHAQGTFLVGEITTTYNKLVETFGQPNYNNGPSTLEKVTIEWVIKFQDGTIATIYDWKNYGHQPAPNEEFQWHIGGHCRSAVALVKEALGAFV